jgi:serine/threonine-protein kinase
VEEFAVISNGKSLLEIGTVLNKKWVILEFIGKGGMGEVYRAHQLNLKRDVAIKIISPDWLQPLEGDEEAIETGLQRFRREVHAMAQVRHPNFVQIFDHDSISVKKGEKDELVEYIAMEYIPGGTLRSTMSEEGFYPDEDTARAWLMDYFIPVLESVQAMHELKIVHRDLKPENVLMDGNTPKIADFGLACSPRWKPVTQSIDIKGTPAYMSPEHFLDFRRADQRADIYSLGKILFEAIEGKVTPETIPFKSVRLANPDTPFFQKLSRIINDATAEDKKERLGSVEEFRNALVEAIGTVKGKTASHVSIHTGPFSALAHPKWIWTGIVVASISVVLMTLWHLLGEPGRSTPHSKGPPVTDHEFVQPRPSIPSEAVLPPPASPAPTLEAEDRVTLHLVPGGKVTLPENFGPGSGKLVKVDPFYMDETQVTNYQYVDFLDQVLPRIRVKKGVVQSNGHIWLLLGEMMEDYEPIVFRDGKFFLKDPALASHPVVRVTAYGAAAYARFYGRRLPTEVEWLHAMMGRDEAKGKPSGVSPESSGTMDMEMMHRQMYLSSSDQQAPSKLLFPVVHFKPNVYGIRGLARNVGEWVLRFPMVSSKDKKQPEYLILGSEKMDLGKGSLLVPAVSRHPWEAFEGVGFRCALSVKSQGR